MLRHAQLSDTNSHLQSAVLVLMTPMQNFIKRTCMTARRSDLVAARQVFFVRTHALRARL